MGMYTPVTMPLIKYSPPGAVGKAQKRGLVIIISNDFLSPLGKAVQLNLDPICGAKKDGERMDGLFTRLGFATLWKCNITFNQLQEIISDASHYKYPKCYECLVFVFSTHGRENELLYMQDGETIAVNEIIEKFYPENAQQIGTIPKIFLIDACRGDKKLHCVPISKGLSSDSSPIKKRGATPLTEALITPQGNYLVAFSTMPNYKSYEIKGAGGIWMQTLADKIECMPNSSVPDVLVSVAGAMIKTINDKECMEMFAMEPDFICKLHENVYFGRKQHLDPEVTPVPQFKAAPLQTTPQPVVASYEPFPPLEAALHHTSPQLATTPHAHQTALRPVTAGTLGQTSVPQYEATPHQTTPQPAVAGPDQTACAVIPPRQTTSQPGPTLPSPRPEEDTSTPPPVQATYSSPEMLMRASPSRVKLTKLLEEQGTSPQYFYTEDGSSERVLHKCNVKTSVDGSVESVDGGGYYGSKNEATEQASLQALKREYVRPITSRSNARFIAQHKDRLKRHIKETKGQSGRVKYTTKDTTTGSCSTVFATGLGRVTGEAGGSVTEAEDNAARAALQKLQVEGYTAD